VSIYLVINTTIDNNFKLTQTFFGYKWDYLIKETI